MEDFEEETKCFEIKRIRDKVTALKSYGDPEIKKLAGNLPELVLFTYDNENMKRKLNNHHAWHRFKKQKLELTESIVSYTARMRYQVRECEFGNREDKGILEHLIQTIRDKELVKRTIQKR